MSNQFRSDQPEQLPEDVNHSKRTWNTPVREPWNPIIKHCLNAIDYHIDLYMKTNNSWHLIQAEHLRTYLHNLKIWITAQEKKHHMMNEID